MAQQNKRNKKKSEVQKYHDKSQFKGEKRITANERCIKRNHQKINDAQVFTSRRVC